MKTRNPLGTPPINDVFGSIRKQSSRIAKLLCAVACALVIASCGGGGGGSSAPEPPTPPPPPTTPPPTPPPQALTNPIADVIQMGDIQLNAVKFVRAPQTEDIGAPRGTNQAYARVQYLQETSDGSQRLFFNDNRGILYVTDGTGIEPRVYLDLREQDVSFSNVAYPNESGFMGFAFHPDFGDSVRAGYGKLYVAFSATPTSGVADFLESASSVEESVVYEFVTEDPSANQFQGTSREILRIGQFQANHNIGNLAFNPNAVRDTPDFGALYVSLGDGGGAHDPREHGQNKQTPLGAILRIDPLGGVEGESKYGIPTDNPFIDDATAIPEVWAFGLRHPQNFSWDASNRMFILDIGQNQIEEVNLGVSGGNYGWRRKEGIFATVYGVDTSDQPGGVYTAGEDLTGFNDPIAQYDHDEGFAIGSGFVYQGEAIPSLVGKFVFCDLVRGRLFYIDAEDLANDVPKTIREIDLLVDGTANSLVDVAGHPNNQSHHAPHTQRVDLRLSVDARGELYLLTKGDGWIRKLELPQ